MELAAYVAEMGQVTGLDVRTHVQASAGLRRAVAEIGGPAHSHEGWHAEGPDLGVSVQP